METLKERIRRVILEPIAIVPYNPRWPVEFQTEKAHLLACLPADLIHRIEHFGSTSVPGLAAKPIIDMLIEVADLTQTRERIVPLLEAQGYEYFWRPTHGEDGPPFYAWFIKRNPRTAERTHHLHMVEGSFTGHWDRLLFRDYLIAHPPAAQEYADLKRTCAREHSQDRLAYTQAKTEFILRTTEAAKGESLRNSES
jgi:GrpB-like predicted nucleotidyltransferase (UPF0157 family)